MTSPRNFLFVLLAASAALLGGCGSDDNPTNPTPPVSAINGDYAGIGTFLTNLSIVDTQSSTPPTSADCSGDISILVDDMAQVVLVGSGACQLPANSASYTLEGEFADETNFSGTITFTFNNQPHVLSFTGTRNSDALDAVFRGRTAATTRLVIDWDGGFTATRTP